MRILALAALTLASGALGAAEAAAAPNGMGALLERSWPVTDDSTTAIVADDSAAPLLIDRTTRLQPASGQVDLDWNTERVYLGRTASGAIDSLQVSLGRGLRTPGGLPLSLDRAVYETDSYEVALRRDWTFARFDAGAYDVDFAPHAGFGWSNQDGATAEAGATLRLTQRVNDEMRDALNDIGVRDGSDFGERGRWYMFAAASGRAVGLNMLRNETGWDNSGLSTDAASALIGDAHVGVGWRKGPVQTSLGYIHREVKGQNMIWGQKTREDSMVAFSLTIKPQEE